MFNLKCTEICSLKIPTLYLLTSSDKVLALGTTFSGTPILLFKRLEQQGSSLLSG
jgi:hypothetical protein